MDRRQRKTREAIFAAFSELLINKGYSQITVQEIIDGADVGRTTFYAHFPTKDDLLREMCEELFEHVFSGAPEAEPTHDFSMAAGDPKTIVTHILYHLREHGRTMLVLLTCESGELFQRYFHQYFNELVTPRVLSGSIRKNAAVPDDLLIDHISGSFVGLVRWWLKNDMKQSPEEIAGYFAAVIRPVV
ncbi:MAG TPA: TetR/AcrR family transcriptional regulator [Anaerovoracaceae bacterium]|nr:TetR/AcrR family transcriptional regulator [Anaerovoracaceae bacterium]